MQLLTSNCKEVKALEARIRRSYGMRRINENLYRRLQEQLSGLQLLLDQVGGSSNGNSSASDDQATVTASN